MTIRILLIIFVLLFDCVAHAAEQTETTPATDTAASGQVILDALPSAVRDLLKYALDHEGISYHRGGNNPEVGFDCSGFVGYIYDHVEGVALPHSAKAISRIGNLIKLSELLPGDLVFFHFMSKTISHVGIYLGNDQFIHASSTHSGKVMVSTLADKYWAKHFMLARRLELPAAVAQTSNQ